MTPRVREVLWTLGAAAVPLLFGLMLLAQQPNFFWQDDAQTLFLPAFADIARALGRGEWPLLSPHSWMAGDLLGELQFGLFSVFVMAVNAVAWKLPLSLAGTAAVLSIAHLMVLSAGSFRLARSYALPVGLAVMVAVAATLNGWNLTWAGIGWLSHLTSFAWLPWAWWALRQALAPDARPGWWALAGGFIYLLVTAGWPPTVLMLALVSAMLVAQQGPRAVAALGPLAAAWMIGLGLSAPALLPFAEYVMQTVRGQVGVHGSPHEWQVPWHALWGFFYPGDATPWSVYDRVRPHLPIELADGVAPAAGLLFAVLVGGKDFVRRCRWELAALAIAMGLCLLPGAGMFRWSFRWLQLVHLLMPLVAAIGLAAATERRPAWLNPGTVALAAVALGWLIAFREPELPWGLGLTWLAPVAVWAAVETWEKAARWRPAAPALVALASLGITYAQIPTYMDRPAWPMPEALRQSQPFEPDMRYLALAHFDDYFGPQAFQRPFGELLRPGNSNNYAGVEFVNGYSSLGLTGLFTILQPGLNGYLRAPVTDRLATLEAGPEGLLQQMAIDGLVLGQGARQHQAALLAHGWSLRAAGPEAVVMHRNAAPSPRVRAIAEAHFVPSVAEAAQVLLARESAKAPIVLVAEAHENHLPTRFGKLTVTPLSRERLVERVRVKSFDVPGLVLFSRPWYPGLVARLDGEALPVRVLNLAMPGVIVPPDRDGILELAYRPWTLALGLYLAGLTLLGLILGLVFERRRVRPVKEGSNAV